MRILGISPLDKDSTVCLVEDGRVISAIAEERLSRQKMHSGFPYLALEEIFHHFKLGANDIDKVVYAFLEPESEARLILESFDLYQKNITNGYSVEIFNRFRNLPASINKVFSIPGLPEKKLYMEKSRLKKMIYQAAATWDCIGIKTAHQGFKEWLKTSIEDHQKYGEELLKGLDQYGLRNKLMRVEHHMSHAANAYYTSGFDEALVVTLDGYGSGLAGSVSVGRGGILKRIHRLPYPNSLGEFYERVTSSLGFKPSRHEGKIVGLAAYDDPKILRDIVKSFFEIKDGDFIYKLPHNIFFTRYLASRFPKPTVAAAFQRVLEEVASQYVAFYQKQTGIKNLALSGGVVANVKANQRMFEVPGIENIFIHPNMGDGGCGVGAALMVEANRGLKPYPISDVYWGPEYSDDEIKAALLKENLTPEIPQDLEGKIAELLVEGNIVARFNGRMEYGPRALGNRSILYHAKDPSVNLWLNHQLNRTEFMPFAPATLYEAREKCYKHIEGGGYAAEFMTITFDCTEKMIKECPAAVHVDGTARPQLVRKETNPSFYKIIKAYEKITGVPSIINTSFNMHEEPIVCTPYDAIRAFKLGHLHYLAIGPYLVKGDAVAPKGS